ncbi:MAG: flagellar hook-basal body complex protein FliE [Armatimonadota bacterium]|jgi:flagellar hook-basal body complex protein FliE
MRIDAIASASGAPRMTPASPARGSLGAEAPEQPSFAAVLQQSIDSFAGVQAAADAASQQIATGDLSRLHEGVIALQEASLALDLVVSVRNRVVEGVQELLRTQV